MASGVADAGAGGDGIFDEVGGTVADAGASTIVGPAASSITDADARVVRVGNEVVCGVANTLEEWMKGGESTGVQERVVSMESCGGRLPCRCAFTAVLVE